MNENDQKSAKRFYQSARKVAQWIAAGPADDNGVRLLVDDRATVHPVEDGAFVETSMWVPRALVNAITDASGRLIAPPQTELPMRPSGPWDRNGKDRP